MTTLDWPPVRCSRCDAPAVLVGWFEDGCYCDPQPLQALCEQHNVSAPVGEMLVDLRKPRGPENLGVGREDEA